jgi:membrane protein implicated in regulation of membrane protease activity
VFVTIGAIAAAAAAYFGFAVPAQVAVFAVVLVGSLVGLRSRLIGRLGGQGVPSRTEQVIGRNGMVTSDIDPTVGTGRVNVAGEDWAARSPDRIEAGATIRVVGADGIVLEVTRA